MISNENENRWNSRCRKEENFCETFWQKNVRKERFKSRRVLRKRDAHMKMKCKVRTGAFSFLFGKVGKPLENSPEKSRNRWMSRKILGKVRVLFRCFLEKSENLWKIFRKFSGKVEKTSEKSESLCEKSENCSEKSPLKLSKQVHQL